MPALYVKVFAERNSGGTWLNRLLRKNFRVTVMDGTPALDGAALRKVLQTVPSAERLTLHNMLLNTEHDRMLYSDFGWTGCAPPVDIIRSAAHTRDTHFIVSVLHPLRFLRALHMFPRTPGAVPDDLSFADFLIRPFPLSRRDGVPLDQELLPMELWQRKVELGLAFLDEGNAGQIIRMEDLEADAGATLSTLNGPLMAKPGSVTVVPQVNRMLTLNEAQEAWVRLPLQTRQHVARMADRDMLSRLGYTMPDMG
ncbi:hypothetical protein [Pontivivens insulae]|uniref:Sulfotransferase domain-containing protein n=1 Tax=Pontivivens insulae TaxID=1639689 RepID=A0A2R8AD19_9RHOB|nr:hypothetical protein [Pontivivens insulae]RED14055.1 hypothetical protein DFR53_1407 [Pontivivens insulae]SPF30129.1 hypothetical protein POI8812_02461 [Pontivivens insulae]